jgi:hypothetical protein
VRRNNFLWSNRGSVAGDVIIFATIVVFVILPIFFVVFEKYIFLCKAQLIKDALDITNISTYQAIKASELSRNIISFDSPEVLEIYKTLLTKNLDLEEFLKAKPNGMIEGNVLIDSLECYTELLPTTCPCGKPITRPSVHSLITVYIQPVLFREMIIRLTGKELIEVKVHIDSDIPINN